MSASTSIQWTGRTWNPVRGCSRISPGCVNCYAERQAARFAFGARTGRTDGPREAGPFAGFVRRFDGEARWTGKLALVEEKLREPLSWRKPQRVFVNSMSDLFHEALPDEAIAAVFGVMAAAAQHTFQVLTKRPQRMREWFRWAESQHAGGALTPLRKLSLVTHDVMRGRAPGGAHIERAAWPLPNVWLGVSVEDQQRADERISVLLETPAAVRFVSAEPLIGPVGLTRAGLLRDGRRYEFSALHAMPFDHPAIDWVIVGGESGPGARPCDVAWIRSIVEQCRAAGTACFVKQLGAWPFLGITEGPYVLAGFNGLVTFFSPDAPAPNRITLRDRKGGDPAEWPEELRVREFPAAREAVRS